MFLLIAVGLLVIWLFPCVTRAVPSTLIAIVVVTLVGMIKNRSRWLAQRSIVTVATVVVVVVTNNFACGAAVGIALYYLVWLIRRRRKVSGEGRGAKANVGRESALWKS